jgi:nitrogenase molybdenum-iron protein NifN
LHAESDGQVPTFIHASTPSYAGSHAEGFHNTVLAAVKTLSTFSQHEDTLALLPGMVSPADVRYLKEILDDFKQEAIVFPDYSETLDNVYTSEYQLIPSGGTPIASIQRLGNAKAVIQLGTSFNKLPGKNREGGVQTAGEWLESTHFVPLHTLPLPIGIEATDAFMAVLEKTTGKPQPEKYLKERGRLLDSYVDAHKYVFGKKVLIYGEPDLVAALSSWTKEIGMEPFAFEGADFETMREHCETIQPDLLLGNSKGYYIARERDIPLVRLGFPIHDRMGANRIEHLGYRGTQQLFDRVVNALLEYKQDHSPIGYKYL